MNPELLIPGLHMAHTEPVYKRLVIAVDGLDKQGKTHFALSAPKPLVYLDFDIGKEGPLEKAPGYEKVIAAKPFGFRQTEVTWEYDKEDEQTKALMKIAEPELVRFRETYLSSLRKPVMKIGKREIMARSVVVDTSSETWELIRFCEFGKLTKVMPHHYTQVNSLMRDLVRAAFDSNVNVIWLHKLKAEWKDNSEGKGRKTGVLERAGFDGMAYLVQANLMALRVPSNQVNTSIVKWKSGEGLFEVPIDPRDTSEGSNDLGFRLVVGNSRHDPSMEGMIFQNDQIHFPSIAQMMMPSTTAADWGDSV